MADRGWQCYRGRLAAIQQLAPNYDRAQPDAITEAAGWRIESHVLELPVEAPGEPVEGGSWQAAKEIIAACTFPDPKLIVGIFDPALPLADRHLLLKGRSLGLTWWFGAKVSGVIDEVRGEGDSAARVWGWGYHTLQGHFEMGEIMFTVWKFLHTGCVEFHIDRYSKPAYIANPFYRIGFAMFGRALQDRFTRTAFERMGRMVADGK
jgi:hypothetical protein